MRTSTIVIALCMAACAPRAAVQRTDAAAAAAARVNEVDRQAILRMVATFRAGVRERDEAKLTPLFLNKSVPFVGVTMNRGEPTSRQSDAESFIWMVLRGNNPLEERFWNIDVRIDDDLAVMVSRYSFHVGGKMTNQGHEIWTLARVADGWKIVSVIWSVKPPV